MKANLLLPFWVVPAFLMGSGACVVEPEDGKRDADAPQVDAGLAPAPSVRICDGEQDLRLGMLRLAQGGWPIPGSQVIDDNGYLFLYVDGSCRYWVKLASNWEETRTGTLSPEAEAALTSRVRYSEWRGWSGTWTVNNGAFDVPARLLYPSLRAEEVVACLKGCAGDGLPPGLTAATEVLPEVAGELWDAGTPLDGGVRFVAVSIPPEQPDIVPFLSWDVPGLSLAQVAIGSGAAHFLGYGEGHPAEGEAAARMRELRAQQAAMPYARNGLTAYIPVKDTDGGRYQLYMRDALPFENDAGVVRVR